jgi:2-methylfumaryl-CoA isomerase
LSLADVALSVAGNLGLLAEAQLAEEPRARYGNDVYGTYARDFRTSDGRYVMVVALTARQWRSLLDATGLGEQMRALETKLGLDLRREGDRFAARAEIAALIEPWVAAHTFAEVKVAFDAHQVLWGPFQTFQELVRNDPRCSVANPMVREVDQPGIGTYLRTGTPLDFSGATRLPARPSPVMGADTRDVLASWLGLDGAALADLAADGVIPA